MTTITTQDGVEIFYKDWDSKNAPPIFFHHGWPLSPVHPSQLTLLAGWRAVHGITSRRWRGAGELHLSLVGSSFPHTRRLPPYPEE
jgi:pimeloyl-ACP methyl ester carboxylesterase